MTSAAEELAKLKRRRDQANKRIAQLKKNNTPINRQIIEKEKKHILAYNKAVEAQKKLKGEKTVAEAKQSEFSTKVKTPKKQPSSLKNNNKTNAMKDRTGKAPTTSNNKKDAPKPKQTAPAPKPKQAAPAPKPKDKPVRGPKNIKSRLKTVSDKRKAEEVSARKKASKEQPIGPSDAPKESKKKEGKSVKESLKDMLLKQDKRTIDTPVGKLTVDSTDEGMSKFLGSKEDIERQEMEEEMNLYRGGMAFGKGGMYKGPKKTYGMRKGGFTNRGQMS